MPFVLTVVLMGFWVGTHTLFACGACTAYVSLHVVSVKCLVLYRRKKAVQCKSIVWQEGIPMSCEFCPQNTASKTTCTGSSVNVHVMGTIVV